MGMILIEATRTEHYIDIKRVFIKNLTTNKQTEKQNQKTNQATTKTTKRQNCCDSLELKRFNVIHNLRGLNKLIQKI